MRRLASLAGRVLCALLPGAVVACSAGAPPAAPGPAPTNAAAAPAILPAEAIVERGATLQFQVAPAGEVEWTVRALWPGTPARRPHAFPLAVSADGRYLVDQRGVPWRVQADAAWLMSTNATPEEVDTYLRIRKAQGFNAFYLMAMVHPRGYGPAPHAPNNHADDPPFAVPGLFTTAGASPASERYWAWIDSIVEKAASQEVVVMLAYTYLGFHGGNEGWYQALLAQPSRQACFEWGRWLGRRYKDRPNLIWFALGDYTPPPGSEGEARALAIIEGIKAGGARQLFMVEASGGASVPTVDAPAYASLIDMNSFYGYGSSGHGECYVEAARAREVAPPKPAWVQEGGYEHENNTGGYAGLSYETRRTRYWAVLGGGTAGDGFGSLPAWAWGNIPASLQTPGAIQAMHAFELFDSLPWWDLSPSGVGPGHAGRELVTSGRGTWGLRDYVTSAVTSTGSHLLAYVPPRPRGGRRFSRQWMQALLWLHGSGGRTIGVDLSALAGPARAAWFDPSAGDFLSIEGGRAFPNAGTGHFTTPAGERADGTDDWLLVLEADAASRCGAISATGLYAAPPGPPAPSDGVACQVNARLTTAPGRLAHALVRLR